MRVQPLEPRRVRYPRGAYGWVELKVVTSGILERVGSESAFTYLFLCAVGNMQGVSFWRPLRMAQAMGLALGVVEAAVQKLQVAGLIATNGRVIQVLPLETEVQGQQGDQGVPVAAAAAMTTTMPPASSAVQAPGTAAGRQLSDSESDITEDEIRAQEILARGHIARVIGRQEPSAAAVRGVARGLALKARLDGLTQRPRRSSHGGRRG